MSGESNMLLTIDVEAELNKLALGRLKSREQAPLALARYAAATGARRLKVEISKRKLTLIHDGKVPGTEVLEGLKTLLDRGCSDHLRHAALVALEDAGMLDLLVAFSLPLRRVVMECGAPLHNRLEYVSRGARLRVSAAEREQGVALLLEGGRADWKEEARELVRALRFADFEVELNGVRVDKGAHLEDSFARARIGDRGRIILVGIPRRGLAAVTRFLVNGVLEEELWQSPGDGLVFEAVVSSEVASCAEEAAGLAHREALGLYRELTGRMPDLQRPERMRMKQLFYRLADHGSGADAVKGAAIFERHGGGLATADELRAAALGRLIRAVDPDSRPGRYDLSGEVFVLDESDRVFVESHLGLIVREPPRRPGKLRLRNVAGRFSEWLREKAGGLSRRLTGAAEIPAERLGDTEKQFLIALQEMLDEGLWPQSGVRRVAFGRGRFGPPGKRRLDEEGGLLLLTRRQRSVKAMLRAFDRDRGALYAAVMAIADGGDPFGDERQRALEHVLGLADS